MKNKQILFRNREISWLDFNMRVLQEALNETTPLIERLKFLGIFSNNLDEFFRVRVATLNMILSRKIKIPKELEGFSPKKILKEIAEITKKQQLLFHDTYEKVRNELVENNISIIDEKDLSPDQEKFVRHYFRTKVRMNLFPIMISHNHDISNLKDKSIYLAVLLKKEKKGRSYETALIELPSEILGRFLILENNEQKDVIFLDDVIRLCLDEIFSVIGFKYFEAYAVKFTRNAELDLDNDISKSFLEIMSESIKQRVCGNPVRLVFDEQMPDSLLKEIIKCLGIKKYDLLVPGEKYHNFKDFISFPAIGEKKLRYPFFDPLPVPLFSQGRSIFQTISEHDVLIHYPYNTFQHIIDLLREASIDSQVTSIKMTLYRVADNSSVVNALINAARNGKKVTVFIEIKARFDEEANIKWAKIMHETGIHVIENVPSVKVHCKLCLIKRKEGKEIKIYSAISTGNFNERTSSIYCDEMLITKDKRICAEIDKVFDIFSNFYKNRQFRHLLVAPGYLRSRINRMIDTEIKNAKTGKKGLIVLKMNSLTDPEMAEKLVSAAKEGVDITLIVRGACLITTGKIVTKGKITVISIVDRFLEHSRIFVFHNNGKPRYYLSSADLMTRNLDRRIEVAVPIYKKNLQKRIDDLINIQLSDNVKSRLLLDGRINEYRETGSKQEVRSQVAFYEYLKNQV